MRATQPDVARAALWVNRVLTILVVAYVVLTIVPDGQTVRVTASLGVAIYPLHATSFGALLRSADVALYDAKRTRNTMVLAASNFPNPRIASLDSPTVIAP